MRFQDNPVLQGMQMGNELSKINRQSFADAMQNAARLSNAVYMQNNARLAELQNLGVGLTANGLGVNQQWNSAESEPMRKLINDSILRHQFIQQYGSPTFVPYAETVTTTVGGRPVTRAKGATVAPPIPTR